MKVLGFKLTAGELGTDAIEAVIHGFGVLLREAAEQAKDGWTWEDVQKWVHDLGEVEENKQAILAAINAAGMASAEVKDLSWTEVISLGVAALQEAASVKEGYDQGDDDPVPV